MSSTDQAEIEGFLDPDATGKMDVGLFVAICTAVADPNRAIKKIGLSLKILKGREVDYRTLLAGGSRDGEGEKSGLEVPMEDLVQAFEMLSLPLAVAELELVVSKFQRRGQVKFSALMDEL